MEEGEGEGFSSLSPLHGGGGDGGKELLRHLLKDKTSPAITLSYTVQASPSACRQLSNESVRSEEEDMPGSYGNVVRRGGRCYFDQGCVQQNIYLKSYLVLSMTSSLIAAETFNRTDGLVININTVNCPAGDDGRCGADGRLQQEEDSAQ